MKKITYLGQDVSDLLQVLAKEPLTGRLLSQLLQTLALGIDDFAPEWGLEDNWRWQLLQEAKQRALNIADELDTGNIVIVDDHTDKTR